MEKIRTKLALIILPRFFPIVQYGNLCYYFMLVKFINCDSILFDMDQNSLIDKVSAGEFLDELDPAVKSGLMANMRRVDRMRFIPDTSDVVAIGDVGDMRELIDVFVKYMALGDIPEEEREVEQISALGEAILRAAYKYAFNSGEIEIPLKAFAYNDFPIEIGYGQTCSQPTTVAYMVGLLDQYVGLEPGKRILEVGTGCGYHAANVLEYGVHLSSIEVIPKIAEFGRGNLEAFLGDDFKRILELVVGDGSMGYAELAPYDAIYLTAGVDIEYFDPDILGSQLKPGGVLMYPQAAGPLIVRVYHEGETEEFYHKPHYFVELVGENSGRVDDNEKV